jgi:O-antigen/teichoic acid export membrane protein
MQGIFALTSIGIGIRKKTRVFPILTVSAAILNVLLNVLWIPRFGILGAAWATVFGYALMAVWGAYLGGKLYPIPFEWSRLSRVVLASGVSFGIATLAPLDFVRAVSIKVVAALAFPLGLWAFGFFRDDELEWLRKTVRTSSS